MTINIVGATDEEFNHFVNEWSSIVRDIHLPADVNPHIGTSILSDLDEAYAILRIYYAKLEGAKDRVDSLVRQYERSKAEGSNEQARRKAATEYLENYENSEGQLFDMYEYQRRTNRRFFMLKGLIDIINNKQQRLITMTGLIKIDSNLGIGNTV